MIGPIARILLRVLAGFLIAKGWFAPDEINALVTDVEVVGLVEMALAGTVWGATEAYYYLAKRWGWAT